jgi:photosystem II stability/assembly factor-like uncharacterized protein
VKRLLSVFVLPLLAGLVWFGPGCQTPVPAEPRYGWVVGDTANGYGTILHTTDYGDTWGRQGSSTTIPNVYLGGVSAADDRNVWVVGNAAADLDQSYGTILHTTDGGQTWTRQGSAGSIPEAGLSSVSAVSSQVAWAVGWQGVILKTTDRGASWARQAAGMSPLVQFENVSAWDANVAWAVGQDSGYSGPPLILHTSDGGTTWTRQGQDSLPTHGGLISVHAASSNVAWVVGTDYIGFRTTDAGQHWYRAVPQAGIGHVNGVCATDEQTAWLAVDYSTVMFTPNAGDTWVKQSTPGAGSFCVNLGVTAVNTDTVWVTSTTAVGPGQILRTFDRGVTWTLQLRTDSAGLGDIGLRGISFAGAAR